MDPLHIATPLWHSLPLSRALGAEVHLKMEALQPVGSFKLRGIGAACQEYVTAGARRLVASSGGNAGLAVAFAGRRLGVPVEVFVPRTTPVSMRERIRALGAAVHEHGECWDDAHAHASALAVEAETAYLHPFDDPRIWAGHATLVHEVQGAMPRPDAVVVSVGGGGLLIGVLQGLHAVSWQDVPVVAVETEGAASFAATVAAGRLVELPRIDSLATSLGARRVAAEALAWSSRHEIRPVTVSDRAAVEACLDFADQHRVLVEPACGASLAVVRDRDPSLAGFRRVVVVVCGGAGVDRRLLARWAEVSGVAAAGS